MASLTERLAHKLGRNFGKPWNTDTGKANIGAWYLDHNPTYGGAVIEEIITESGAVNQPFGSQRRSPSEFCETIRFCLRALDIKEA